MSPQLNPDEQVLMALDKALKAELTAVHQYLLHSRMCHSWGYSRLAESNRKESLEELEHAGLLIDRILFLQGTPNVTELLPIQNADRKRPDASQPCARKRRRRAAQFGCKVRRRSRRQRHAPVVRQDLAR